MSTAATPNRLLQEKSLYLRKHAYNPVDWQPWGEAALAEAAAQDRPLFVSIGYSSCHWCTVMENEAFSDPEIARYLNEHFVAIKVDREERPDIDSIYMQALQLMNQQGGWPLNVFLTPGDLVPFYGGTYFPVQERYGRPGFLRVLEAVRDYYKTQFDRLSEHKTRMLDALQTTAKLQPQADLPDNLLKAAASQIRAIVARESTGPNFPMIPYAGLALRMGRLGEVELAQSAAERGEDLAMGGIFDHLGGGFHRYTVDNTWTVPHFEKMLFDNGQIVEFLSDLWAAGIQEPAFARAIDLTHGWLEREMTDRRGYFYAAQDADSEGEEGKFYVWTYSELESLLEPEALSLLKVEFYLKPEGNFEGKIVLQRRHSQGLSPQVESILSTLAGVRSDREPPVTDTKLIVAWNALMISGLTRAGDVLGKSAYRETAVRAARFILETQLSEQAFYRINYDGIPAISAKAEDYALFIKALLDLHASTQDPEWLYSAQSLQALMDKQLWDLEGGYFSAPADPDLLLREKEFQDSATPAANGIALANLVRLFMLTDQPEYLERAEALIRQFGQLLAQAPRSCPSLLAGYDWYLNQTLLQSDAGRIAALLKGYWPVTAFKSAQIDPGKALICEGLRCLALLEGEEAIAEQLRASSVRTLQ